LFPTISVLVFWVFDIYDGKKHLRIVDEFGALTLSWMFLSVSLAGILYFSFREVSRALYFTFVILVYFGVLAWRSLIRFYFRIKNGQGEEATRRILIIGIGPLGQKIREILSGQKTKNLRIVGFLDDNSPDESDSVERIGGIENAKSAVQKFKISDVIIALPYSSYENLGRVVGQLEDESVRVWVALGFLDLALYKMDVSDIAGIPMLDLRAPALNEYQMLTKRIFDLVIGSLGVFLFSPIMLISGLLIWIADRGPVIFKQMRVGENGKIFTMYKFRTMVLGAEKLQTEVTRVDEDGNLIHKAKDDPRVTTIGRFLRRSSIDELPQLINVLQGTMSIVGPRPELPYLVEKYQPWQRKRFSVPPGITGWWQVIGRSDRPMYLHTEDDMHYIQNYSIWLDIQIFIRTIWIVIIGKGSY